MTKPSEPDLIDRIAAALPKEVRADYYREVSHCRSLPENDEMLRILRVMLILTLLTETVPNRMVEERQRLDSVFRSFVPELHDMLGSVHKYHSLLDQRLESLPQKVAAGLNPEAVAASVNESLRQRFEKSTIPVTAHALTIAAAEIRTAATEFSRDASNLGSAYRGAAQDARNAIAAITSEISGAAANSRRATAGMIAAFQRARQWVDYTIIVICLMVALSFAIETWALLSLPEKIRAMTIPKVVHSVPEIPQPKQRLKTRP